MGMSIDRQMVLLESNSMYFTGFGKEAAGASQRESVRFLIIFFLCFLGRVCVCFNDQFFAVDLLLVLVRNLVSIVPHHRHILRRSGSAKGGGVLQGQGHRHGHRHRHGRASPDIFAQQNADRIPRAFPSCIPRSASHINKIFIYSFYI